MPRKLTGSAYGSLCVQTDLASSFHMKALNGAKAERNIDGRGNAAGEWIMSIGVREFPGPVRDDFFVYPYSGETSIISGVDDTSAQ